MASQIAFQDNMVIKIKTERDLPPTYCSENHGTLSLDSPQQNGRLASVDCFHHTTQQMMFQDPTPGKQVLLTTRCKPLQKEMSCKNRLQTFASLSPGLS